MPPLAVPPLSCNPTVTVAEPLAFEAGVNVSSPAGLIDGCVAKSALLSFVAVNESVCDDSSDGPPLTPAAHAAEYAPLSSLTLMFVPAVKDGASLTALIVIVTVA